MVDLNGDDQQADQSRNGTERVFNPNIAGALALIPVFSGDTTKIPVREFIKNVTAAGKLTNCNDSQLAEIAKIKLTGLANVFLDAHPHLDEADWPTLKKELQKRFSDTEEHQDKKYSLRDCVQGATEPVREYVMRLKQLGYQTVKPCRDNAEFKIREEILQEELLAQFMKGLSLSVKHAVYTRNPKTLDDAADEAIRQEKFIKSNTTQQVCALTPTPRPRVSRRSDFEQQNTSNDEKRGRSPDSYKEYNSRRDGSRDKGHRQQSNRDYNDRRSSSDRHQRTDANTQSDMNCWYCKQPNHTERFCLLKLRHERSRGNTYTNNNSQRNRSATPYRYQSPGRPVERDNDRYSGRRTPSADRRGDRRDYRRDRSDSRTRYSSQDRYVSRQQLRPRSSSREDTGYPNARRDSLSRR